MDWAYLAISVNGALYTVNAYRPRRFTGRFRLLYAGSFMASWITIELAWVHLVAQVAATAFFARHGALRTRTGKLALVVNVATCVGLAGLVVRSLGVRHEVRKAFKDYETPALDKPKLGWRRTRNVEFAKVGRKALRMDVYEPKQPTELGRAPGSGDTGRAPGSGDTGRAPGSGDTGRAPGNGPSAVKRPAVVQIHGGGWVVGDKREQGLPLLKHMAARGWVGFNVNYRLSPWATYPDHLVDVKRALAYIRRHADEYGIDPDFIAVTGGSAGGHLAAMMALTADDPELQPGFEQDDLSVQAAVPIYGFYDFTNRNHHYPDERAPKSFIARRVIKADPRTEPDKFRAASPMEHVRPDAPPFYVIHGSADTVIPVGQARDFVDELRSVSKSPVLYLELEGAQHAFEIFPSIRANAVVRSVARFLEKVHDEYEAGREGDEIDDVALLGAVDAPLSEDVSA
jgi:acetyl esterase/lipase